MRPRLFSCLIAILAISGIIAVPALAAKPSKDELTYAKVYTDFANSGGQINPCKHTSDELRTVIPLIPADFQQYNPDFEVAIKAALRARARGDCAGKQPQAEPLTQPAAPAATPATPVLTPVPTPIPTAIPTKTVVPEPPQPIQAPAGSVPVSQAQPPVELQRVATATPANDAPAPVLLLALLAALLLVSALFLATMRRLGWADERLAGTRHAFAEAGWRFGGMWEDFRDWVRLGR